MHNYASTCVMKQPSVCFSFVGPLILILSATSKSHAAVT